MTTATATLEPKHSPQTTEEVRMLKLRWSAFSTTETTKYTAAQREEIDALYREYSHVIDEKVRAFCARWGGHYDDLRADALHYFLMAYDFYDRSKPFKTHLGYWVWYEMFDAARTRFSRQTKNPMVGGDALEVVVAGARPAFDEEDFAEGMSPDARRVLHLTLHGKEVDAAADKAGGKPHNVRAALRAYLADIGWCKDRIAEAFDEVKAALR